MEGGGVLSARITAGFGTTHTTRRKALHVQKFQDQCLLWTRKRSDEPQHLQHPGARRGRIRGRRGQGNIWVHHKPGPRSHQQHQPVTNILTVGKNLPRPET